MDISGVSEDESSDAGGGQFVGDDATESTDSRDEYRGILECLLPGFAESGHPHLPLVDGFFVFGEWRHVVVGQVALWRRLDSSLPRRARAV